MTDSDPFKDATEAYERAQRDAAHVASREQHTPQGLAEFYKAEVDKWWPILKAANIKGE